MSILSHEFCRGGIVEHCASLGLDVDTIVAAQPPFGVEDNVEHFKAHGASVIVTKDSGAFRWLGGESRGGANLESAHRNRRPPASRGQLVYGCEQLSDAVREWG